MKIIRNKEKYKKYQKKRERKNEIRRIIKRNSPKKVKIKKSNKKIKTINILENFDFFDNTEKVIKSMNDLDLILKNKKYNIFIDMSRVVKIDFSSILILISKIKSKNKKILVSGNESENIEVSRILRNSGYLKYFRTNIPFNNNLGDMFESRNYVDEEILGEIIEKTTKQIWGENKIVKGMYRMVIELMLNTKYHASGDKHKREKWWFQYNFMEKENKVEYIFLDNGLGVMDALSKSEKYIGHEKIKKLFFKETQEKFLNKLINGEIKNIMERTSTGKRKHGKGLPTTKEAVDNKYISNLKIVTNNVYGKVDDNKYSLLTNKFSGTLFKWEVSIKNKNIKDEGNKYSKGI